MAILGDVTSNFAFLTGAPPPEEMVERAAETLRRGECHCRAVIAGRLLCITGKLQHQGEVSHLIAWRIEDLSVMLDRLGRFGRVAPSYAHADGPSHARSDASRSRTEPRLPLRRVIPAIRQSDSSRAATRAATSTEPPQDSRYAQASDGADR